MANLKDKLFWEKFRPNSLEAGQGKIPIILLPRIANIVNKGVLLNYMFYGSGGQGKSTLAAILTEDCNVLKINGSKENGVDIVRDAIEEHVKNFSLLGKRGQKVIWIEEFGRTTPALRNALLGFIEEHPDVRFIVTLNTLSNIQKTEEDKALISRFNVINFDPINRDEIDFIKAKQLLYLKGICKNIQFNISDDNLVKLNNKNFPNFRASVQKVQEISISGDIEIIENIQHTNSDIFKLLMDGNIDLPKIYYMVTENYPKDASLELLNLASRPFFKYLIEEKPELILKVGKKLLDLSKEYNAEYAITADPELHVMNYIVKIKELFVN